MFRARPHLTRILSLSLRTKITALIIGVVALSVLAQVYFASNLIVDDKAGYIYRQQLSQLALVSSNLEGQLEAAASLGSLLLRSKVQSDSPLATLKNYYDAFSPVHGVEEIVLLEPHASGFRPLLSFPENGAGLSEFSKAPWNELIQKRSPIHIAALGGGRLHVASLLSLSNGKTYGISTLLHFGGQAEVMRAGALLLTSKQGEIIYSNKPILAEHSTEIKRAIGENFSDSALQTGVKNWELGGIKYIVGYQKISSDQILAISLIPHTEAFTAARALVRRSVVLGLCVLMIALGISSIFINGVVGRVKQLWDATLQVRSGNFLVRLPSSTGSRDELTGLAHSFNLMSEKIGSLLEEAAQKARMEKELETAQALQNGFFPSKSFKHQNFVVHGECRSSTECSGDWWDYKAAGNILYFVIGDVTGHGVSSALLTAAAHGVFHQALDQSPPPGAEVLMRALNKTIFSVGKGHTTMTLLLARVDLDQGLVDLCNSSHLNPILLESENARPRPIILTPCSPLGHDLEIDPVMITVQLKPGDSLLLFTDGVFAPRNFDAAKISKRDFLKLVLEARANTASEELFCSEITRASSSFLGAGGAPLHDDITIVVAGIPASAQLAPARAA